MKYIPADKLIAEIKKQKHELELSIQSQGDYGQSCHIVAYENILSLIGSLQQEQPEFPTTDEEIEKALASIPKVELPDKYKTPDWLFKQQEQPEVDLDDVIENYILENFGERWDGCVPIGCFELDQMAEHFYRLGFNARKEENK